MFVIERDEWSAEFPAHEWRYLKQGFMVREDDGTLIHYDAANACLELVSRTSGGAA
jgi:hypothetical protein